METKKFMKIGDRYVYLANTLEKTTPVYLTEEELQERFDSERDEIIEISIPKEKEPGPEPGTIPDFQTEAEYLNYIYSENDREKRIAAKNIFEKKFMK